MTENQTDDRTPHLWIDAIQEEDRVSGCYLVKEKRAAKTRNGNPFLSLTLADRTGEIPAKVWDRAEMLAALFHEGDLIQIEGHAGSYRDQIQLTVSDLKLFKNPPDPEIFLEVSPKDPPEMTRSLREILRGVRDAHLKRLVDAFLNDREFMAHFKKAPAAKTFHHGYLGGLLEHTLSVCRMANQVADHYPQLNRDLLLAAAFLHDIGKIRELKYDLFIDYTDEGRLVGHVVLGVAMVDEKLKAFREFPQELAVRLKHLIVSHHGQYDFGSPKAPKFLEAFALHLIDDLDAKINGLGRFMERDRHEGAWTDFNRMFGRYFLKGEIESAGTSSKASSTTESQQGTLFSSGLST
ncbi:MAG: CRISPR-associated endonuclease Cas3'' [Deltaproteobacteria bacterium]|nr:CRISPR-associated endonuclease Cas3'' [Deltaproteobacteria bacterium]